MGEAADEVAAEDDPADDGIAEFRQRDLFFEFLFLLLDERQACRAGDRVGGAGVFPLFG